MNVPVNIISGFLGVGKTTAILDAFRHKPPEERWAVLVNEFGEVGLDGASLEASGGYVVKEIAGGCICCTAGPMLKINMVRLLREEKPDRIFIEPTGLAHPATIIDMLRSPGIRDIVQIQALIGLVNPSHFSLDRYRNHETYQDQLQMADLLIGNHWDTASDDEKNRFLQEAANWFPPKIAVHHTQKGQLDADWLNIIPLVSKVSRHHHDHPSSAHASVTAEGGKIHDLGTVSTCGWVFPSQYVFDRLALMDVLQTLVRPDGPLQNGALRVKGVFRTPRVWLHINGTPDTLTVEGINYRRDSRLELIIDTGEPDWTAIESSLLEAVCAGR